MTINNNNEHPAARQLHPEAARSAQLNELPAANQAISYKDIALKALALTIVLYSGVKFADLAAQQMHLSQEVCGYWYESPHCTALSVASIALGACAVAIGWEFTCTTISVLRSIQAENR